MPEGVMKAWLESSHLSGANTAYIEELYEHYLENSQSVSDEWRAVFDSLPKIEGADVEYKHSAIREEFRELAKQPARNVIVSGGSDAKQVKVLQLINARTEDLSEVILFEKEIEPIVATFASFAALAINSQDATAMWWNPGGLAFLPQRPKNHDIHLMQNR